MGPAAPYPTAAMRRITSGSATGSPELAGMPFSSRGAEGRLAFGAGVHINELRPRNHPDRVKTHRIALYPGDGIGPEVTDAAVAVLVAAERCPGGFHLEYERFDWGVTHYDLHGRVVPEDFLATLRGFDAIFLGAVGWPARLPDHVTLAPLIRLRQAFDLYACVRPARTFPGVAGPLRDARPVDLVVVRENSEGEYVDNGGVVAAGTPEEIAGQTAGHSRRGI